MTEELVNGTIVVAVLGDLGLSPTGEVHSLPGGVSNRVYRAATAHGDVVIKQSVERLMVADEWLAARERIHAEAAALEVYHSLDPDHAPPLIAVIPESFILVMGAAPPSWRDWKSRLRAGVIEPTIAVGLGRSLRRIVDATRHRPLPALLTEGTRLRELRLDPYFATTAARRPELAGALGEIIAHLASSDDALVHGDFSPKNILTDGSGFWMTDFEVAHRGDPTFDLAFLLSHLMLKTIADPGRARNLGRAATSFLDAYDPTIRLSRDPHVARITGALIASRVDGRSPVDYLDVRSTDTARALSGDTLAAPDRLWHYLERTIE